MAQSADQLGGRQIYDSGGTEPSTPPPSLKDKESQPEASETSASGAGEGDQPSRDQLSNAEKSYYKPSHDGGHGGAGHTKTSLSSGIRLVRNNRGKTMLAATAAAIVTAVIIGVLFLVPLKILSFVTNIQKTFAATSLNAVSNESENLLDRYMIKKVLPNLGGACNSTISIECSAAKSSGNGPISTLFNDWRENRTENKLATDYGIVLGKKGNTYYISTDGKQFGLGQHPTSIFNLQGVNTTSSRAEVRAAIGKALEDQSLWQRTLFRFRFGRFLEKKYGIVRCIITCKLGDNYADSVAAKKLAAKAYLVNRVIEPVSESYSLIIQCVLEGNCTVNNLDKAQVGDTSRQSEFQKKLQAQLQAYADRLGTDALKDLVQQANDIGKDGFKKYLARKLGEKIAGEAGGKYAADSIPVIGGVLLVARLFQTAGGLGSMIRDMSYAANAAAAVQLYESYNTVASEMKSGHVDPTELGSFTDALSSNLDGSAGNQSDMTQTPLYQSLYGSNNSGAASIFDSLFLGKAYAATATVDPAPDKNYTCDDGKPVPTGQLVCAEEKLDRGNKTADDISKTANSITGSIPFFGDFMSAYNKVNGALGTAFGTVFNAVCWAANLPPGSNNGCLGAVNKISGLLASLMDFVSKQLIVSPFSDNQSGGRTGDMMIAGGDVLYNSACQEQLGCARQSNQTIGAIRNSQIAEDKAEFDSQPLFARIFSTDTPYSLASRLAMNIPASSHSAITSLASFFIHPVNGLATAFSGIFDSRLAFAATAPQADPFGVVQYGYQDSQIPSDPDTYWDDNCVNGPMAKYDQSTGKLDISDWLNNVPTTEQNGQPNTTQDPNTGVEVNLQPNPCMLIKSSTEALGGLMDPGLLPAGSMNSGTDGQ